MQPVHLTTEILKHLRESSVDCIRILDRDGRLVLTDPDCRDETRDQAQGQAFGQSWIHLWAPDEQDAARHAVSLAAQGGTGHLKANRSGPSGETQLWSYDVRPIKGRHGDVQQLMVVSRNLTGLADITEQAERAARRTEALLSTISEIVWHSNADQTKSSSVHWAEYCGPYNPALNGAEWLAAVHPDDRQTVKDVIRTAVETGEPYENTYRLRHRSGEWRWVTDRVVTVKDQNGFVIEWVGLIMDIHDRVTALQALHESEERVRLAVNASGVGIWDVDLQNGSRRWSNELKAILGLDIHAAESEDLLMARVHPEDRALVREANRDARRWSVGSPSVVFRVIRADTGDIRWVRSIGHAVVNDAGAAVRRLGTWQDVTEATLAEQKLWQAAHRDPLTLLANRSLFNADLDKAIAEAERSGRSFAVVVIDIDDFKDVNDTLGHAGGDRVLQVVARRLETHHPRPLTLARVGGDEFALLIPDCDSPREIERFAERLNDLLNDPIEHGTRFVRCAASVGVAFYPDQDMNPADCLKNADLALYAAKKAGGARHAMFSWHMKTEAAHRVTVLRQAREALETDNIVPFYQPKVALDTGAIDGFEALLRWKDGSGWRMPSAIAEAFEDPILASQLGMRMLDLVVADLIRWRAAGVKVGRIGLNVSSAEFHDVDVAERLLAKLEKPSLEASDIEIEVTESVILGTGAAKVGKALQRLHRRGVSISLDDFGTGFASLTHLRQYPFDWLKIDRSFIVDVQTDPNADAIVSAVIGLAHGMGRRVVAEGVETVAQLDCLRRKNCDVIQGYLAAKPMPASRVSGFLKNWTGLPSKAPPSQRSRVAQPS